MPKESPDAGDAELRSLQSQPLAQQSETPAADDAELRTPEEHATALKGVKEVARVARVNGEPATFKLFHWQHAAAAALHGWKEHEHHEAKPISLTLADYKAALLAASNPVTRVLGKDGKPTDATIDSHEAAKRGIPTLTDYEPHKPALSLHKGKG